ncbi:hypothetical protein D3227_26855 [Mesorhizobium waimense]|uniref:Uncharacterized protein n=1 Tax=Mesorhizobium waimense TaxID=1300307 RepID=A0A3A5KIV0_9HYPH|nr:hypothetical protein [Mesorhizobium waimense]RJT32636.1 hypothetical protein D3227_26855 [Mesorhizobium waimense]
MARQGFRYTIAGESNPYWVLVEPILLRIWAEGIAKTSSLSLHMVNGVALITHVIFFAIGVILRLAAVGALLFAGYALFPQTLEIALGSVFSAPYTASPLASVASSWIYELLGYVLIVTSIMFVIGGSFFGFLGELLLYLLFAVTHMAPLRLLAVGLRNENYWAQSIAKTSFMGMYLVQSVGAFPDGAEWDRVFDLYLKSNTPHGREQLEKLADEWSTKLGGGHHLSPSPKSTE